MRHYTGITVSGSHNVRVTAEDQPETKSFSLSVIRWGAVTDLGKAAYSLP